MPRAKSAGPGDLCGATAMLSPAPIAITSRPGPPAISDIAPDPNKCSPAQCRSASISIRQAGPLAENELALRVFHKDGAGAAVRPFCRCWRTWACA